MLYFVCYESFGFVVNKDGGAGGCIREALPFTSFSDADDFGRSHSQGVAYAVLSNCIGEGQ